MNDNDDDCAIVKWWLWSQSSK